MQEACNLKMNLLARAITQPRESWFDFSIFEDCGRGLRGTLGHLFVTRIDLLCLLGKIRILAAASRFSPCPVNLWGLQKIYLIVLGLIVELQRLCIVDVVWFVRDTWYPQCPVCSFFGKPMFLIFLTLVIEINTIYVKSIF